VGRRRGFGERAAHGTRFDLGIVPRIIGIGVGAGGIVVGIVHGILLIEVDVAEMQVTVYVARGMHNLERTAHGGNNLAHRGLLVYKNKLVG
jgi:hypothetical protein